MTKVAHFNGIYQVDGIDYSKFQYRKEQMLLREVDRHECSHDESDIEEAEFDDQFGDEVTRIAEKMYCINIFRFSVMLTAGQFVVNVLQFLNKYLPGSIYLNYYFDGIAGLVAYYVGGPFYRWLGIKSAFITSLAFTLVMSTFLYLLRIEAIPPNFIVALGSPESGSPPGSSDDVEFHMRKLTPWIAFFIKFGAHLTNSSATIATAADAKVFPHLKRTTGIGTCIFISRFITIFAPLVAELEKPLPTLSIIVITMTALLVSFTFPTRTEEEARIASIKAAAQRAAK